MDFGYGLCTLGESRLVRLILPTQQARLRLAFAKRCMHAIGDGDYRFERNAVHRARDDAQLAAGAIARDHGVHAFGCANDGVGRANGQAGRAANARGLVNQCNVLGRIGVHIISERNRLMRKEFGQRQSRRVTTGWATIDLSLTRVHRFRVGMAIGIAAALALRLRQQRINGRHIH